MKNISKNKRQDRGLNTTVKHFCDIWVWIIFWFSCWINIANKILISIISYSNNLHFFVCSFVFLNVGIAFLVQLVVLLFKLPDFDILSRHKWHSCKNCHFRCHWNLAKGFHYRLLLLHVNCVWFLNIQLVTPLEWVGLQP